MHVLEQRPVDRGGHRHAKRHRDADQLVGVRRAGLMAEHPGNARTRDPDRAPGAGAEPMAEHDARHHGRQQRAGRHRDQHVGDRGHRDRDHEGRVHHRPAQRRRPHRPRRARQPAPERRPAHHAEGNGQGQRVERAAPEGHLEAARGFEMPRDDACRAPQQRHQHHQRDGLTMRHRYSRGPRSGPGVIQSGTPAWRGAGGAP